MMLFKALNLQLLYYSACAVIMKSNIQIVRHVSLRNPILLCGLPGIGSIATSTIAYLLYKLNATLFAEIKSPFFQDIVVSSEKAMFEAPLYQLYYGRSCISPDMIFLFGNTQPSTSYGQYELCTTIVNYVHAQDCRFIISLGGVHNDHSSSSPQLFGVFTDSKLKTKLTASGIQVMEGRVYGMAGLLVGVAALKKMTGFCLLGETSKDIDVAATIIMAKFLNDYLSFQIDIADLPEQLCSGTRAGKLVKNTLHAFGGRPGSF
jgi:proteasome assembly chaperone (PAC2) family protein